MRQEGTQKVIPTGSRSRTTATSGAPATMTFIVVAVIFYLLGFLGIEEDLVRWFAQINVLIAEGEWWRIFTVVLLHGSITHILFNMWALWVLGPQIERGVGTWPFVSLFLASAGVGGVFAYYLGDLNDIAVGASGAIFGLFGIWLSWALHRRNTIQGRALLGQLVFLLLINAAIPFRVQEPSRGRPTSVVSSPDSSSVRSGAGCAAPMLRRCGPGSGSPSLSWPHWPSPSDGPLV